MTRIVSLVLAYLFVALALVGVVLPGLPTVPFLLLAAWFSAKGSERLYTWLHEHPKFGTMLNDWKQQGAVSRRSKIIAVLMLCGSWSLLFCYTANVWVFATISAVLFVVSLYIVTRPEPQ